MKFHLLYPQLKHRSAPHVAILGAIVALALIPVAPAGVPVIAAAAVALSAGSFTSHPATQRDGNRSPDAAPHGIYPCRPDGDRDRWIAIACTSDAAFAALMRWSTRPDASSCPEASTCTRTSTFPSARFA